MTVREMRREISKVYPGECWKNRVSKMPEDQVIAVYFSFLETGRFTQKKEEGKASVKKTVALFKPYAGEQITFDI